ncbi:MAG TPA: hypothetical protein VIH35_02025 [Kiritimatiellia bacterium]
MLKLALVMGRQGSGKTTRVCRDIQNHLPWWNFVHRCLGRRGSIEVWPNHFNHMDVGPDGELIFVTGDHLGKTSVPLGTLREQPHVLEFPHSGFIPPDAQRYLNNGRVRTKIFHIELPEAEWRGHGGDVGPITSPDFFMQNTVARGPRSSFDYRADVARIREQIAQSRVPVTTYASTAAMIRPIGRFLLFG